MLTTKAQMEKKTANSDHTYICSANAPVIEVIEALQAFLTYSYGLLKQQQDQQQEKQKATADVEPKPES